MCVEVLATEVERNLSVAFGDLVSLVSLHYNKKIKIMVRK